LQACQLGAGIAFGLGSSVELGGGGADLRVGARQVGQPLALAPRRGEGGLQRALLDRQLRRLVAERLALLVIEQFDAIGASAQLVERAFHFASLLEHPLGNQPVDIGAGQLFEQLGALVGRGFQKGREAALGQQHRLGETAEIQTGQALHLPGLFAEFVGDDLTVQACQLGLGALQRAIGLVPRPALAPERPVALPLHLELDLGQALGGVPGHQLVLAADLVHARGAVIQRQADGIEQRGLARAGRPGNGEQTVAGEGLGGEIDLPLALQRVEVLQAQAEDFHGGRAGLETVTDGYFGIVARLPLMPGKPHCNVSSSRSACSAEMPSPLE